MKCCASTPVAKILLLRSCKSRPWIVGIRRTCTCWMLSRSQYYDALIAKLMNLHRAPTIIIHYELSSITSTNWFYWFHSILFYSTRSTKYCNFSNITYIVSSLNSKVKNAIPPLTGGGKYFFVMAPPLMLKHCHNITLV